MYIVHRLRERAMTLCISELLSVVSHHRACSRRRNRGHHERRDVLNNKVKESITSLQRDVRLEKQSAMKQTDKRCFFS